MSARLRGSLPALAGTAGLALSALFASTILARAQDACPSLFKAEPGETLEIIADRCRIPLGDLFRANPALREARMPLDGLTIHVPENHDPSPLNWNAIGGPSGGKADWRNDADFWTPDGGDRIVQTGYGSSYRVHEGDTLGSIAASLNVSLNDMLAANPDISDPDALYAGELINVPGGATLIDTDQGRRFYHRYHMAPHITAVPTPDGNLRVIAVGLPPHSEVSLSAARQSDQGSFATARSSGRGTVKLDVPLPPEFAHDGNHVVIASVNGEVRATSQPISSTVTGAVGSLEGPRGYYPASYRVGDYGDHGDSRVGEQLTINGVVTPEGNQCPAVRDASGKLYSLATTNETLHPGDVISVDGRVAPGDWCSKGIALAVTSLHFEPKWVTARVEEPAIEPPIVRDGPPRYRRESDPVPPAFLPDLSGASSFADPVPGVTPQVIRGVLTDEAPDCTTVRGDDGTLYAIPARLTSAALGRRLEIRGHIARGSPCSVGVTFKVEDARKL